MLRNRAAALIFSQSARSGSARRVTDPPDRSGPFVGAERGDGDRDGDGDAPAAPIPGAAALPAVDAIAAATISASLRSVKRSAHDVSTDRFYCATNTCVLMYLL